MIILIIILDNEDEEDNDKDCRDIVSSFFIPADNEDNRMDCADDPIRLTDNELSIEGLIEELNNALFITHWPSVMLITLVLIYSVISELTVSIIGNAEIEPPIKEEFNLPQHSRIEEWILNIFEEYDCLDGIEPIIKDNWR